MITDMRKGFKVYAVRVVLWLIIISMALGYIVFRQEDSAQRLFLHINGTSVSRASFEQQLYKENQRIQLLRERLGVQNADLYLSMLGLSNPKMIAFNTIVRHELLNQIAQAMNISVAELFIVNQLHNPTFVMTNLIETVPAYIFDPLRGTIDAEKLNQYLRYTGISMAEFEESVENIFKRNLIENLAGLSSYILPEEVIAYFNEHYSAKKFEILVFSLDSFKKQLQKDTIDAVVLKQFFDQQNQRSKRYFVPEKRSGSLYVFTPQEYDISLKNPDITGYYNAHKASFIKKPAQAQLRTILFSLNVSDTPEKIKNVQEKAQSVLKELQANPTPTQFEALARKYSDDKNTASAGGLLAPFVRGTLDQALEEAFFKLRKDGEISDIITTDKGLEIIQRVSRSAAQYKTVEEATDDIIAALKAQEFKKSFTHDVVKAIKQAKSNPEIIKELIEKKHAKQETINHLEKDDTPKAEKFFKMRQGEWGYYFDGNKAVLLFLADIYKSQPPSFETVQNQVKNDYILYKAQDLMQKSLEKALKEANQASLQEIALKEGAKLEHIDYVAFADKSRIESLQKQGLPVDKMMALNKPGAKAIALEQEQGYLIQCTVIEPLNQAKFDQEKRSIIQTLYKSQKPLVEAGFVASLFRNATIKSIDPELTISNER